MARVRARMEGVVYCEGKLEGRTRGQGLVKHGGAGPAPVYIKVHCLLTGFGAVIGRHVPVVPARYVCLGRELIIEEGAGIMIGGHA